MCKSLFLATSSGGQQELVSGSGHSSSGCGMLWRVGGNTDHGTPHTDKQFSRSGDAEPVSRSCVASVVALIRFKVNVFHDRLLRHVVTRSRSSCFFGALPSAHHARRTQEQPYFQTGPVEILVSKHLCCRWRDNKILITTIALLPGETTRYRSARKPCCRVRQHGADCYDNCAADGETTRYQSPR
ncbi:hypothetical protein J6590_054851 [Homalodisca vitripennis]|nr:hypothetical protein J6590_054851 [Homalodisca vitripennis]